MQQETNTCNLQKTRSCENLAGPSQEPISSPSRRKSDPSIILDNFDPSSLTKDCDKTSSNVCVSNGTVHSEDGHKDSVLKNGTSPEKEQNGDVSASNGVVSNGHCSDLEENLTNGDQDSKDDTEPESNDENNLVNGQCNRNSHHNGYTDTSSPAIECSTDTITDGESKHEEKIDHQLNGTRPAHKLSLEKLVTLEKSASISTSTSDISNSNVDLRLPVDSMYSIHQYLSRSTPLRLTCSSNGFSQSKSPLKSLPTTPVNSQSSTCPPTPATDKVGIISNGFKMYPSMLELICSFKFHIPFNIFSVELRYFFLYVCENCVDLQRMSTSLCLLEFLLKALICIKLHTS